jgi:hypothetical protein
VRAAGDAASAELGTVHAFLAMAPDTTRYGVVHFSNASGRHRSKRFVISAEHERESLLYDQEAPKTHYELQRIPDELKRIADEIARAAQIFGPGTKP